jgi:hypothetical protein
MVETGGAAGLLLSSPRNQQFPPRLAYAHFADRPKKV